MTLEIRPFGGGWKVRGCTPTETDLVGPAAIEHALNQACRRAVFSAKEIYLIKQDEAVIANIPSAVPA